MRDSIVRKGLVVGIIILFLGASIITSMASKKIQITSTIMTMQNTWYVDDSGDNNNTGTSWENAWCNISYAINNPSVINGDTIQVGEGTYNDNMDITKSVNFNGNGSDKTFVLGDGNTIFNIMIGGVKITNFGINNSYIFSWSVGAITAEFYRDIIISDNSFTNNAIDIVLIHCEGAEIKHNRFNYGEGTQLNYGIIVYMCADINILENYITDKKTSGILLSFSNTNYIYGNIVENNLNGLILYGTTENIITINSFTNNDQYGIYLVNSYNDSIYKNNIEDNIRVEMLAQNTVGWYPWNWWGSTLPFGRVIRVRSLVYIFPWSFKPIEIPT